MTLQQLQYFITVCKYQSLTKAARELSISPPDENYRHVTLEHSRLLFCVHQDNPLAGQRIESLAQLENTPLIMLSDHYSQTKYLKRLFRAADYVPNVIQYTSQVFTILQHIRANAAAFQSAL